jgi:hypothetical protein
MRDGVTVLPAFGEFTGGFTIAPRDGGTVWVTDGRAVHRVPTATPRAGRAARQTR